MQAVNVFDVIAQILSHVPLYVWGILALLVVMGRRQSRTQVVSRKRLVVLPLVWLVFGAWGVENGFGQSGTASVALTAWALGLAASVATLLALGWPGQVRAQADTGHLVVPGSWLPLVVMLSIFVCRFAVGMALGVQPSLSHSPVFAAVASLSFGLLSGFFLGRSINILRRGRIDAPSATPMTA